MQLLDIIHVHLPIFHTSMPSRPFATCVHLPSGQFSWCSECVGSLHGSPLLRKKLFHPRRFLDPSVVHWDLTSSCDDFPIGLQFAAVCLCEVPTFGLSLHSPARGAKDTFLVGAPGCKTYSLGSGIFSSSGGQVL